MSCNPEASSHAPLLQGELSGFAFHLAQVAIDIAKTQAERLDLEVKSDGSPVSNVDKAVERAIRDRIEAQFPNDGILGEEFEGTNPDANRTWVIDPIDGTRQFVAGLPNYGILIALCDGGVPKLGIICQPDTGDIFLGITGAGAWKNGEPISVSDPGGLDKTICAISDPDAFDEATRPGMDRVRAQSLWNVFDGGCLSFGALAQGRLGVSLCGPNLDNFDICALVPVVVGAGGLITDWQGRPLTMASKGAIVASASPDLHKTVLALLNGD